MFYREAEQLDRLGHHGQIPKLLAYCAQNRLQYLVQEWIDGQDLKQELRDQGPFPEAKIWAVLNNLLPVLQFLHQQQIIHRDIKPANIMRRSQQADDTALVLIDFGIAKVVTPDQVSRTGTIVGSPEYMPPEQQRGKSYPASDLYSLGVTCLYLLTHTQPLEMYNDRRDRWQWRDYLPLGHSVSRALTAVLEKLTMTALNQRYQSAQEVWLDVQRYQQRQQRKAQATVATAPPGSIPPPGATANAPGAVGSPNPPVSPANPAPAAPTRPASPPPPPPPVKVHYGALQTALKAGQWEQADRATGEILCAVVNRPVAQGITADDVANIPCKVWEKLDWLWTRYSGNRFGFSPQVRLYVLAEEDYHRFCAQVGWPTHQPTRPDWQFDRTAPVGHLPSRQWVAGYHWWQHLQWVSDRFKICQLL